MVKNHLDLFMVDISLLYYSFIVIYNTHLLLCMYIVLNRQTRVPVNYSDP
jgi:hypothetical protein